MPPRVYEDKENSTKKTDFVHPLTPEKKECDATSENEQFCFSSIRGSQELINQGVSISELLEEHIKRLEYLQNSYRFFITDFARKTAARLDKPVLSLNPKLYMKGRGIIMLAKDTVANCLFRKIPHTNGCLACLESLPRASSVMMSELERYGGILIGKTATLEFGHQADCGITGVSRNPFDPMRTLGGSSGGAAGAIAAGIGHVGIANDGAGSVRIPASFTGTVGVKPSNSLTVGPDHTKCGSNVTAYGTITRTMADAGRVWDILTHDAYSFEHDIEANISLELFKRNHPDLRIAYLPSFSFSRVQSEVSSTVDKAVAQISKVIPISEVQSLGFQDPEEAAGYFWRTSLSAVCSILENDPNGINQLDPVLQMLIDSPVSKEQIEYSKQVRMQVQDSIQHFFEKFDILITPTVAVLPWEAGKSGPNPSEKKLTDFSWNPFTYPFNWSNNTAISLPCGFVTKEVGKNLDLPLPVGLQIVSKRLHNPAFDLKRLFSFGSAIETHVSDEIRDNRPGFAFLRYAAGKCCMSEKKT